VGIARALDPLFIWTHTIQIFSWDFGIALATSLAILDFFEVAGAISKTGAVLMLLSLS
jgi:hypothetical protein